MERIWRIIEECLTCGEGGKLPFCSPPPERAGGGNKVGEEAGLNEREKCKRGRKNYGK